jgi:predicted RNA-binding protein
MDIKELIKDKVDDIVDKIKSDKTLMTRFKTEPVKVVEELIGMDLPDDQIEKLADAVKAKIDLDKIGGMLGGLFGKK